MAKEQPLGNVHNLSAERKRRERETTEMEKRREKWDKVIDSILKVIAAQRKYVKALDREMELYRSRIEGLRDKLASKKVLPLEEGRELMEKIEEYKAIITENDKVKKTVLRRLEKAHRDFNNCLEERENL